MQTSRISEWNGRQLVFGQALDEVEALFRGRGFTFMPIKGAYLLMTGIAASIPERIMQDIDLLIPESNFDQTCNWFATLPNVIEKKGYWKFERIFFYTTLGMPVCFEFHKYVNAPARFLLPNKDLFSRGVPANTTCILPDPTDCLLIHVCHMLVHIIDGFNEQHLLEIEHYLNHPGFSWEQFLERSKTTGVHTFIWLVMRSYSRAMNYSVPLPKPLSPYALFLDKFNLFLAGSNPLLRKIFFEVPFVRNPVWLLFYKMTHKNGN